MKGSGLSEAKTRGDARARRERYSERSARWVVVSVVCWRVVWGVLGIES